MFPGQGAQFAGMGAELFPLFPQLVEQANDLLGYDVRELCLKNPDNLLQQTEYTQPAIFVVNALHYKQFVQTRGVPDMALGHSLGETNALHAAGVFDFETGLRIVKTRGALMAAAKNGGMAAVIGLSLEEVREILSEHCPELDLANINSMQQIVVSGPLESIAAASSVFEDAFAAYVPLRVSGAFHSRYMAQAEALLAQTLHSVTFKTPAFPVISNVSALPYSANDLPHLLIKQLTSPVRWLDSIQYVLGTGKCECHELGPGQILQNLLEKILSGR